MADLIECDADPELVRHTIWQSRRNPSSGMTNMKLSGIPAGSDTSIAAPVRDRLRTMQLIASPTNSIVPVFDTR